MTTSRISLSNADKISLLNTLSTMLGAGIPILEVVSSNLEDSKGNQRKILEHLKADLMQGKPVYVSFSAFPNVFDKVTINLLHASEEAGTLETTLKDLTEHIQKEMEFTDRIIFALIYPALIMCVFAGVLLMILIVVIPKISTVFTRLKVTLPLPTRILIGASNILILHTWLFLGITAVIVASFVVLFRARRQAILELFYHVPLVSELIKEIDFTRFSRNMFLLLTSGLPITTALELSQQVVLKARTAKIIATSRDMVSSGKRLSEGFRTGKGYMPALMIKLTESGEKSGSLDKSMQQISNYLDYQVTNTLKTLTAVLEPVMLILVGISVGAMMLAIIAPIYQLVGQVGVR